MYDIYIHFLNKSFLLLLVVVVRIVVSFLLVIVLFLWLICVHFKFAHLIRDAF